jgi:filamentous hemagglutinin family protein
MNHNTGAKARNSRSARDLRVRPKTVALAVAACFSGAVWANPTNPVVVHGTASFQQAGNILNVTNSHNAIIHWGSFSIGVSELTRFIQPSALSAVLNRVTGGDPSAILGALQSNGRVFLLNPNGIVFGAGAQIDVAGLVASTLNLSNADFLAGRMNFTGGAGAGSIVNQGAINASGGPVYLVGNAVTNQGLITSPGGEIVLAAGNSVELVNPGTPNLRVEIQAGNNEAKNLGSIVAEAGRIGIYAGLIKQGGVINADSAVAEGGRILLKATRSATLESGSVISARGVGGGRIEVLADDSTSVAGVLDASAPAGGNGGFIETSGKVRVTVDDNTRVSTAAPLGKTGVWLIDPNDLVIAATGGDMTGASIAGNLASNHVVLTSDDGGTAGAGDILVNDAIAWNSGNSLTLTARRNVTVNSAISNAGAGDINLYAGWDGSSSATAPTLSNTGMISLNNSLATGGTVQLWASALITQNAMGAVNAAQLKAVSEMSSVTLNAAANSVGTIAGSAIGQFAFSNNSANNLVVGSVGGSNGITVNGSSTGFHANATLTQSGGGQLVVNQPINVTGADGVEGAGGNATIQLTSSGGISINEHVHAMAGAGVTDLGMSFNGGSAVVTLNNTGSAATLNVNAGADIQADGGQGGSVSGGSIASGAGGTASVSLDSAGGLTIIGQLKAYGGSGGNVSYSSSNSGAGGNAAVSTSSVGLTQFSGDICVYGGGGGSVDSGTSGNGGHATLQMTSSGGMNFSSGTSVEVNGGSAGDAYYGSGGSGGNAVIELIAGGNLAVNGASFDLASGQAGNSGYGSTGSTGQASIKLTSSAGSLSATNTSIFADGGESAYGSAPVGTAALIELKSAGNLTVSQSNLEVYGASAGSAAGSGNGGGALISLVSTGGSITVDDSGLRSYGGHAYWNSSATGGNGLIGISAAGNVTVTNGSYIHAGAGDGGEGGTGGGSVVLVSAGGNLSLTGSSSLYAYAGNTSDYSYVSTGTGGGAAITLVAGGPIVVDGSEGYAYGGNGGMTRGSAAVNVIGGGSIAMSNLASFTVNSDSSEGGASSVVLAAAGPVSLSNSALSAMNGGVIGVGGGGINFDNAEIIGGGGVSLSSTAGITAINGTDVDSGGNLNITTLGNLVLNNSLFYGIPDVNMNIGGNVNLFNGAKIEAGSSETIRLFFPNGSTSFFSVNGVNGITYDPAGAGTGFLVMGSPATLGTNMFVTFGAPPSNPSTSPTAPLDTLIVALTQATKPPEGQQSTGAKSEEEDKKSAKKDAPVCR